LFCYLLDCLVRMILLASFGNLTRCFIVGLFFKIYFFIICFLNSILLYFSYWRFTIVIFFQFFFYNVKSSWIFFYFLKNTLTIHEYCFFILQKISSAHGKSQVNHLIYTYIESVYDVRILSYCSTIKYTVFH